MYLPVTSFCMIFDTIEKCFVPVVARLAAMGRMSDTWLHSNVTYFLNKTPAPCNSSSENN